MIEPDMINENRLDINQYSGTRSPFLMSKRQVWLIDIFNHQAKSPAPDGYIPEKDINLITTETVA
jgi:hypothetical protein